MVPRSTLDHTSRRRVRSHLPLSSLHKYKSAANSCSDFPPRECRCHEHTRFKCLGQHGVNVFAVATTSALESRPLPSTIVFKVEQLPHSVPVLTFKAQLHQQQCCGSDFFYQWVCRTQHHARTTIWFSTHPALDPDVHGDYQWSVRDLYLCLIC